MLHNHLNWIRNQFPALHQEVDGQPLVFLDGPGGTQVSTSVIEAMNDYLVRSNANSGGVFLTSMRTEAVLESARAAAADLLGCNADEIVFGANMTTLTFALSRSIGRELQAGDEIIVTALDHDANVAPWRALEEKGVVIRTVDIHTEDCTLNLEDLQRHLSHKTRLVAIGYASNAVGTINDVATIVKLAHTAGALAFVDAVHYAPHGPIDVQALDCDFLACSAYKFCGPHLGILYGKREHLAHFRPYKVLPSSNEAPLRWESGTQNHEAIAGLIAAIEYLAELGDRCEPHNTHNNQNTLVQNASSRRTALLKAMQAIQAYERELSQELISGLLQIPGLSFYGIREPDRFAWRTPTVSIRLNQATPLEIAQALAKQNIFTWDGNFYALNLTERLGVEDKGGLLRIGLVHYNRSDEIHLLLKALEEIAT
jgi:cysteine desulfurase family protein (TIGR01976 family)